MVLLALTASAVWLLLGGELFIWKDQADRGQLALLATGGVGAVAALVISYRKQKLAESQDERSNEARFGERYALSSEQLGSSEAAVRMAGMYSMARLADDWAEQRQVCIDVLCGYFRLPPRTLVSGKRDPGEDTARTTLASIISAHLQPNAEQNWQGYKFDFAGAVLKNCEFNGIRLGPGTDFNFHHARFKNGFVAFFNMTLDGGSLNFTSADFDNPTLYFGASNFVSGSLNFYLAKFNQGDIVFRGASFGSSEVDFGSAVFAGASIYMDESNLASAAFNFEEAVSLSGVHMEWGPVANTESFQALTHVDTAEEVESHVDVFLDRATVRKLRVQKDAELVPEGDD